MRLLIVEDEPTTRAFLERSLKEELFHVEEVGNGEAGESHALAGGSDAPILLLTGRHSAADRIRGVDVGADDYLGRPFAFEELLARLRAITRRGRSRELSGILSYGSLALDQATAHVTVDGDAVVLSDTEFRLLQYLLLRAEKPVSCDGLAQHVWDEDDRPASNAIDVYISYLRKRLGAAESLIRTVRGVGYAIIGRRAT